jgi:hypothetical protein
VNAVLQASFFAAFAVYMTAAVFGWFVKSRRVDAYGVAVAAALVAAASQLLDRDWLLVAVWAFNASAIGAAIAIERRAARLREQ